MIAEQLSELREALEQVQFDEEDYRDNMPENLQNSERYQKADEACDNLYAAVEAIETACDFIECAAE